MTFTWNGVLDPTLLRDHKVSASHRFADAAKEGNWSTVFSMLDDQRTPVDVNWWRPGGSAWFTVLHQAAWHGAPMKVIAKLIERGALRSLPDSYGRPAIEVLEDRAQETKNFGRPNAVSIDLLERCLAPPRSPVSAEDVLSLNFHLGGVIDGRISVRLFDGRNPRSVLRYPPAGILHEVPDQHLWFPVPGMYGGFDITLGEDYLDVKSWSRVVGGSGQHHVITTAGAILVDEGFV